MATCGGFRHRGFEGGLHPQVTCSEREGPVVSTSINPSLAPHGYYRNGIALPEDSSTIRYQTEKLYGFKKFEPRYPNFDFQEPDTDDEAAKWARQPAEVAGKKEASPISAQRQMSALTHQSCDSFKAGYFIEANTFPSPRPPDGSLHIPVASPCDQLGFDTDTDSDFAELCFDISDWEEIPDLECDMTPNSVCEDAPSPPRQHPIPGSELFYTGPDMGMTSHPDAMLPFHLNAMHERLIRSDLGNINVLQKVPTIKLSHRKAARSGPVCSRGRHHRNLKARAQYLRDRSSRNGSILIKTPTALRANSIPYLTSENLQPKRKHCAFVQEQELRCLFEDRVGTPHLSELQPGDDVNAQLNIDELSVGGEIAALSVAEGATQGLSTFAITDIPNRELGPS